MQKKLYTKENALQILEKRREKLNENARRSRVKLDLTNIPVPRILRDEIKRLAHKEGLTIAKFLKKVFFISRSQS